MILAEPIIDEVWIKSTTYMSEGGDHESVRIHQIIINFNDRTFSD